MALLKLQPVLKDYIWGGEKLKNLYGRQSEHKIAESWELSVHSQGQSIIDGGEYNGKSLKEYIDLNPGCLGDTLQLCVLIKFIDSADNLSVQVHPDDSYAYKYENDNGKTEMWYIVAAEPGAGIYCGLKNNLTRSGLKDLILSGKVESALNFIPVKAGDCFLIEAGTLHAVGKGITLLEVQQSSNVTYRVFDYNRKDAMGNARELHIEKALKTVNLAAFVDRTNTQPAKKCGGYTKRLLTKCKYFSCCEIALEGSYAFSDTGYLAVNIISGSGSINDMIFAAGDSFFCTANQALNIQGKALIVITKQCLGC